MIAAVASFDEKFNRLKAEYAWRKVRICVFEDFGCLIKMLVNWAKKANWYDYLTQSLQIVQ